jgi:MerR family mercuric resistance operon transcriptional regulator
MAQDDIAIGELSRRTGCNIETVRYYERVGILPTPARRGRYRLYGAEDVRRLAFVRRARELGFSLDDVRALLGLGEGSCAEARELAAVHLADIRVRITDLKAMERVLADTVRRCDAGGEATCPVIEVLGGPPTRPRHAVR